MELLGWRPRTPAQFTAVSLLAVCLALSATSLIFGLLSWTRIKKWRQFHNYVFLQMIAASVMFITAYFFVRIFKDDYTYDAVAELILQTCFSIMLHWHLVTTVMFYVEIAKAITIEVNLSRGYLFANMFAWVLPIFEVLLDFWLQQTKFHFMEFNCLLIAIVYVVVYLSVIYVLIRSARAATSPVVEVLHQMLVSTFAFLTGGVTLLIPLLTVMHRAGLTHNFSEEDIAVTYLLNIMAVIVFFLSMKNHRESWTESRLIRTSFK